MANNDGWETVGSVPSQDGWETVGSASPEPQKPGQKKEKADLTDAAVSGFYSGMGNLGRGAGIAYMGLQEALPEWLRRSDYDPEKVGKAIQESDEHYKKKSQEALNGKETGYGGAFVSGVAQAPFYAPLLAPMSIAGQGTERAQEVMDAGGDLKTALAAHGVSTVTNAVFQALPASLKGALVKRILSGATLGAIGVPVEPGLVNGIRAAAGLPPVQMPELKDYFAGAGIGGGTGAVFGSRGKGPAVDPNQANVRQEIQNATNQPNMPPEQRPVPESPEAIARYRWLAEQQAAAMAHDPANAQGRPIQMTRDGQMVPPELDRTTADIDAQGRAGQQFDPQALARQQQEADWQALGYGADQSQFLPGTPERIPTLPNGPEPGLPGIRGLPTDEVPLLPRGLDEPIPFEPQSDRLPPSPVDPRLPGAERTAEHMSLLPEDRYPVNDGGVRPTGSDGTPLRGMASDVPTMDFPLRQEVLQDPKVKAAITRFRKRYAEASTDLARTKVENDFANYMKQYGSTNAADAAGLRPLYERVLRDPMAIRKSGELNTAKTETQVPSLGGVGKKQGGAINPDLLGIGKASEILGRMGSKALWNKFRGTFTDAEMQNLKEVAGPDAYKSRSTAVWMSPADFIALANGRDLKSPEGKYRAEEKRASIRKGIQTKEGLRGQMPFLWIEKTGNGYAQAIGHEGRHRADVFLEQGVDLMPVEIKDLSGNRWDVDGNPYHTLESQDSQHITRMFPQDFIFDKPGKYKHEGLQDDAVRAMDQVRQGLSETTSKQTENAQAREASFQEFMDAVKSQRAKDHINNLKNKYQTGAIDPEIYKEGMKRMARALSRLTDQPWVKKKFPASQYETNSDGTPLILLHGTDIRFTGDLVPQSQGIHLGFVVPAHLIRAPGDLFTKPQQAARDVKYSEAKIRMDVEQYIDNELKDHPIENREKAIRDAVANQSNTFIYGMGYNLRPTVVKKGEYPYIGKDLGRWDPVPVMDRLVDYFAQVRRDMGKEPLDSGRWEWYRSRLYDAEVMNDNAKSNKLFTQFLKEHGIDGFFYKNVGESLNKRSSSAPHRAIAGNTQALQHPISFVTWDAKNIESLYSNKETPKVPKKQQGSIDLDLLTGGLSKIAESVSNVFNKPHTSMAAEALPERQKAAIARVPGLAALKDYISKNIPTEQIKAKILEMGDISSDINALIGSKEMMASIKDHPAIYWFGSLFTNARKRGDLYHREYIQPLEKAVVRLSQQGKGQLLATVFKEEMFARKTLDDAALRRLGLDDKQLSVYHTFRREFDVALSRLNEYRRSTGQEEITGQDAYLSSRWRGDWKTPVYDKNGKLIWYIAETSKARAENALGYLKKQYPDLDVSKSKVTYSKKFFMAEESLSLATYRDMVSFLGKDDPAVKAMEAEWKQRHDLEGETVLGHDKHMEPKAGVRGFLGDRPWVNEKQNAHDLLKSQLAYLRNTHTWVELQDAIREANKVIGDKEVQEKAPNLVSLLQDIKQNEMGRSTLKFLSGAEKFASEWMSRGFDQLSKAFPPLKNMPTDLGSLHTAMGWAKSFFYLTKLGLFNIPFVTISLVQPIYTLPHHMRLTSAEGMNHNLIKTWANAIYGGTSTMIAHHSGATKHMTKLQQEAYKYMVANGIGDLNQYAEAHDIGLPHSAKVAKDLGGWSMTESERFSRGVAFMGFMSHLEQSGKYGDDKMAMFQKAEELTNKSMANYRHTERAGLFNKSGFLGNAAATLQTFKINQYNQLYDMAKHAVTKKDYTPFVSLLATQWMLGGVMGMFALDEVEDMWNLIKKAAVELGVKDEDFLRWSPKFEIARRLDDWASYGPFSTTIGGGKNYASRMSAANVVDASFSGIMPFLADYGKQVSQWAEVVKDAVRGADITESGERALNASIPSSLKAWHQMNSKTMVDKDGNPYSTTKDPTSLTYRRTAEDKAAMDIPFNGMQTLNEAKTKDRSYRAKLAEQLNSRAMTIREEKFLSAVRNNNKQAAKEALTEYAELGGEPRTLLKQAEAQAIKRMLTDQELMVIQAKSRQAIERLKRREDYVR